MATAVDRERRPATARWLAEAVQRFLDGDRDVSMRRENARLLLARALEQGDDERGRRSAMRDAGRALAFDPELRGAAELVSRLMLEPPAVTPREVEIEIARDERQQLRHQGRSAVVTYAGLMLGTPFWFATLPIAYAAALAALITGCVVCAVLTARDRSVPFVVHAVGLSVIVGLFGVLYSPLLIAPGFGAVVGMALVLDPRAGRPGTVTWLAGLLFACVFGPWLAEAAGLLPSSIALDASGLHLHAPGLRGTGTIMLAFAIGSVMALIGASVFLSYRALQAMRELRRRLYLQAWQLRQLVSE